MGSIEEYAQILDAMPAKKREQVLRAAVDSQKGRMWIPNPGPQTEAYFCPADELLYGGEPGGGKSDLVIGLSLTAHHRSLVLRRTNAEATKLFDRYEEVIGHGNGKNEQKGWRIGGRIIDIGGCQLEDDKQKRKGVPHDLKAFDELPDFTRTQFTFIKTWNRSTNPDQRCRVVATANPPTNPNGVWVIEYWGPWLDPSHPRPAKSGELRWYLVREDGNEEEVEGPGPYPVGGKMIVARSRTFIRSRLEDNPDLANTGYGNTLAAATGEMRGLASGDFESALEDVPNQCIPTQWVRLAMRAWEPKPQVGVPMCAIGVDASGGGADPMMFAIRYDGWYAPLIETPGKTIPIERAGKFCAGLITSYRRDGAVVIVDMGGGYGGAIYEQLHENKIEAQMFKGAEASIRRTEDKQYAFKNKRTEAYWRFREALDPSRQGGSPIRLPDDLALLAELTAPLFIEDRKVIELEAKDKVVARLGRSPDRADAVVMSWTAGGKIESHYGTWQEDQRMKFRGGARPEVIRGRRR